MDYIRESPTLQLLECMKKHLASGLKIYDPYIKKDIVENQYQDFACFMKDIDMVVIMVGHEHIRQNMDVLQGKIVLDTRNICDMDGVYRL